MITGLFHVAIRTADLQITENFYTRVLGMVVEPRPDFGFPGLWLRAPVAGAPASIHVYAGKAAQGPDGGVPSGTAAIDHLSLTCTGYQRMRERFAAFGLSWRGNRVPGLPLWQLFVHDPSGILLELTFDANAEPDASPALPSGQQYEAADRSWFHPAEYRVFA